MNDALLKNFFMNSPSGSVICESDGCIIAINRAAEEILSAQSHVVVGDNFMRYFDSVCNVQIRSLLELPPDAPAGSAIVITGNSAEQSHIRIEARSIWDSSLNKKLVLLSLVDITRERKDLLETRLSEEKYRALVNFGGDAILVFDFDARVVEANIKAMSLFGYTKREFVGKRIDDLYEGEILQKHRAVYNEILATGSSRIDTSFILTRDKKIIPVNISGSVVEYGSRHLVQMIFRDITDQLKAEEDKNRLISELNQIFNISAIGLCLIGEDLKIVRANGAYERFLSDGSNVIGKRCYELLHGLGCGPDACRVFSRDEVVEYEYCTNIKGQDAIFLIANVPFYGEKGKRAGILQAVTDITQIRKLEKELISIGDRERFIVSQELHDGIGQVLTGMSYLIEKLIRRMKDKSSSEMKTILDINELARDALEKTRNIIKGLVPVLASEEAMISSIMHLADDSKRMFGVDVVLDIDKMPRGLSQEEMTQLYYIIRESMHNSVKHGRPKTIQVKWFCENGGYELSVCDDGLKGVLATGRTGGMGLNIMKYRAGLIGAHLFSGFEGNGFRVKITKKI